jgi:hypothetical protein
MCPPSCRRYARERRAAPGQRDPQDGLGVFRSGGARPQTALIVAYIDAYKDRFGVEPICRVLSEHDMPIAPSTYYAHKRQQAAGLRGLRLAVVTGTAGLLGIAMVVLKVVLQHHH